MDLKEEMVDELPICKNCLNKISDYGKITSSEFVEILRQAKGCGEPQQIVQVDIFGYTRDWEDISRALREKHNYTCEKCGLHIDDLFDRQYMHVHHIDKNKLNNNESNFMCLCYRCHSQVDEYHKKNLTTGANKYIWEAFEKAYPANLKSRISQTSTDDSDDDDN